MQRNHTTIWVLAFALTGACQSSDDAAPASKTPSTNGMRQGEAPVAVERRTFLKAFDTCESLENFVENGMVDEMKVRLDGLAKNAGVLRGGAPELSGAPQAGAAAPSAPTAAAPPPSADNAAKSGSAAASPTAVTRTNTQVEGVDEADFVKNDKNRIFVLTGGRLHGLTSWPPQNLELKQGVAIEGEAREMFLDEKRNRIVVVSQLFSTSPYGGGLGGAAPPTVGPAQPQSISPAMKLAPVADAASVACAEIADARGVSACGGFGVSTTKLTVIDVSNLAAPVIEDSFLLPGAYVNSRRVDGSVRVVLADRFQSPEGVTDYPQNPDQSFYNDPAKRQEIFSALKVKNERLIRDRKLEDWLPKPRIMRRGATGGQALGYSCTDFQYSNAPTRTGIVTVATLNLDTPNSPPVRTSIVAEPGEIYASQKSLYLTHHHWWWAPIDGQLNYTYVHKFDITKPDVATYRASGVFEGHVVDQFALDEHKDVLRVATTINKQISDKGQIQTWSRITTLGETGSELAIWGQTEDLAKDERIYSARFIGDKGFVVTFRQVDPLYTFDLSNPVAPKKIGELKIPGFSSYIHPLGPNHLLTIGVYTPEPVPGKPASPNARAVQLQIFDVSNFAAPRQTYLQLIGTSAGNSEALSEHKAFNFFPEKKLLAIPFTDYVRGQTGSKYWESFVSDIRVYEVDAASGIKERGRLDMRDVFMKNGNTNFASGYAPYTRRSVMASDGMNEFVYGISDAGVRVANLSSLATPLKTAYFPAVR